VGKTLDPDQEIATSDAGWMAELLRGEDKLR
jgi:hypothetical protein